MLGEEVKDIKTLAKIKTVEEMLPKTAEENQIQRTNPKIWEAEYKIIEECLQLDWTIEQWCMLAGISVQSYYKHREKNPEFARRMDIARQFPKMIARAAIQRRIRQWDAKVALDYLKLRDKFYTEDSKDEGEKSSAPRVQFISVASNEWADQSNSDSQTPINVSSVSDTSATSSENQMPWENEEEVLRRLDSSNFSNG